MGDGDTTGAKDISDQIKDEDQLLGAEQKGKKKEEEKKDDQNQGGKEEENKVRLIVCFSDLGLGALFSACPIHHGRGRVCPLGRTHSLLRCTDYADIFIPMAGH